MELTKDVDLIQTNKNDAKHPLDHSDPINDDLPDFIRKGNTIMKSQQILSSLHLNDIGTLLSDGFFQVM